MKTPSSDARRGSPLLLVVLVVLSLLAASVYSREGEAGPLHATRRGLLFLMTPFSVAGAAATRPFDLLGAWFSGLSTSREEVEALRKQNAEMRAALAGLEEQKQENVRLRGMVKLPGQLRGTATGAHVIGRPTDSWEGTILIDRGTAEGVNVGTPVVAAQGLIGQVTVAAPHSARVRLITDQSSGVAVVVQSSRATGVVRGSVDGKLTLDFVDARRMPKIGDVLVTSGLGGAYPKGLVVGDVAKVEPDPTGLFPHVDVVSRVPIDAIEEVLVLVGEPVTQVLGGVE